ncbi:MAG: hypothetical protein JRG90_17340 [Deltaproteobacteria bacterium]|nr:hypothetical protein [Deltaproteobacteria bacterium]
MAYHGEPWSLLAAMSLKAWTDSVFGSRMSTTLGSKVICGSVSSAATPAARAAQRTATVCSSSAPGARLSKRRLAFEVIPWGSASHELMSAGNIVSVRKRMISMPVPAIRPSSATPA